MQILMETFSQEEEERGKGKGCVGDSTDKDQSSARQRNRSLYQVVGVVQGPLIFY
jgi:hypothetical protein